MRCLVLADGICKQTGFGTVARRAVLALQRRGWDISQIAGLDTIPADRTPYDALGVVSFHPSPEDPHGFRLLDVALDIAKPDVCLLIVHPGEAFDWLHRCGLASRGIPTVLYAPLEGSPVSPDWAHAYRLATRSITCTAWGARQLKGDYGIDVPYVYHGTDTMVFRPLESWKRKQVREQLGWSRKFVVAYCARNAYRKRHDALMQAMWVLKENGIHDVHLYLHCNADEGGTLDSWRLNWVAAQWGLQSRVEFAPSDGSSTEHLAERMAAADCCVYPSALEGYGIPIVEAMAVGLPLIITSDHGNMAELSADAPYSRLEPAMQMLWKNGVQLHMVDATTVAKAIIAAKRDPLGLAAARGRSLARAADPAFRWEPMETMLADACEEVVAREMVTA